MSKTQALDISWEGILKISVAVLCFYFLYLAKDILIWFIFALIISVLFNPAIDFLQKRKIPRILSVIFIYVIIFGILTLLLYLTASVLIQEIQQFLQIFPQYFEKIAPPLKGLGFQAFEDIESFINAFRGTLEGMVVNIFNTFFAIFGGIFSTLFVVSVAFFLSLEEKPMEKTLCLLFPKKYEAYAMSLWGRCQRKVSGWFGTRILGCLFVGILSYISFLAFNVEYPFFLGLLAGIFNFIPIVGPIVTGFLIVLIVSLDSFPKAIFVLIVFSLIQQIENNILMPILTKKFIGLPSSLVLFALAVGGKLWGLWGAILVIPLTGILFEFLKEFLQKRKAEKAVVL